MLMALGTPEDLVALLGLRRHLSIIHHLPGRIRMRLAPVLWGRAEDLNRNRLQDLLDRIQGIRDVRVNKAVASIIIEYDPHQIPPEHWETLVHGDAEAAREILGGWLKRYGRLLRHTLKEKE